MPRPKRSDCRVSACVSAPLRDALDDEAAQEGLYVADVVRRVLIDHVARRLATSAAEQKEAA
jgi:hypothetical protein